MSLRGPQTPSFEAGADNPDESIGQMYENKVYANDLCAIARKRWFKVSELEFFLNEESTPLPSALHIPSRPPPSGTLLLYDRNITRNYKMDGHDWVKRRNSTKVREDHVKLRVNGECRGAGFYAHSKTSATMHRRAYHLLDPNTGATKSPRQHQPAKGLLAGSSLSLVLVHYLDTNQTGEKDTAEIRQDILNNSSLHDETMKRRKIADEIDLLHERAEASRRLHYEMNPINPHLMQVYRQPQAVLLPIVPLHRNPQEMMYLQGNPLSPHMYHLMPTMLLPPPASYPMTPGITWQDVAEEQIQQNARDMMSRKRAHDTL